MKVIVLSLLIIGAIIVMVSIIKSRQIVKNVFLSIFQGIASLLAVNVLGLLTGVTIPFNWYTISFVSVFGMPSCIALLLADTMLLR